MSNLLSRSPEATEWSDQTIATLKSDNTFGSFNAGVVWVEIRDPSEGTPILVDPEKLAKEINERGQLLLLGHDPGKPIGRVVAAKIFDAADTRKFVGAVFGYYAGAVQSGFADFGFDSTSLQEPPRTLPEMGDDLWIEIAVDPREVAEEWVDRAAEDAPLRIKKRPLSHNAAEAVVELIRVTVPYIALVWNPFVTAIATEAGKDTYKAFRGWLGRLIDHVSEHKTPILVLQASLRDCDVMFILRGNDMDCLLAARDGLEAAAVQANHLVATLRQRNTPLHTLYYEFDASRKVWIPSYAELKDGRLITDNRMLVVAEKLPQGLSLGFGGFDDE